MNMKSQLAIASLLFAGVLATGCSQQQSAGGASASPAQQTSQQAATTTNTAATTATTNTTTATTTHRGPARVATTTRRTVNRGPVVKVPSVKVKGNYKGPVAQDAHTVTKLVKYKKKHK